MPIVPLRAGDVDWLLCCDCYAVMKGAAPVTALSLVAPEMLTLFISKTGCFGATCGSLGAIAGIMLWFNISA